MKTIPQVACVILHRPLFLFLALLLYGCADEEMSRQAEQTLYKGPLRTLENAEILHSDSGRLKARVKARKILDLQNQDREVPEGVHITFYEKDGTTSATLQADYAYFYAEEDRWLARGNVVIHNLKTLETLKTEELYWYPESGDVKTEKFVKIETPEEIITGTGLTAKQDFSTWSIKKPEGVFIIEDEE